MFPSPKSNNSPNNSHLYKTINDTYNGNPKITSTPLHSLAARRHGLPFSTSSKPRLPSFRRYSLSDVTTLTNGRTPPRNIDNSSGPLLTSINYKDNVSTYEETKSPGLAGRVVQYSEEVARKKKPLCQEKYNSLGLFPIVHLFNKKTSSEQLPKPVFIKIGTPELVKHIHPEHSNKILESITKPANFNINSTVNGLSQAQSSSRTENVLDALKEISRKRIHGNEDFELHEDHAKKQRTDDIKSCNSNKRAQDNSSGEQSPNSSCKPISKKICVYDEYAASKSSTNFSTIKKNNQQSRTKRKTTSTSTEISTIKQTKYVNAETQTAAVEPEKETSIKDKEERLSSSTRESPVKVFNEVPLEKNRKNRLAALMGTLVGKEVALLPKLQTNTNISENLPENIETRDNNTSKEVVDMGKPLTSILSLPNQMRIPNNKHVHFSISNNASKEANTQLEELDSSTSNSGSNETSNIVTSTPTLVSLPSFSQAISKSENSVGTTVATSNLVVTTSTPLGPSISKTGGFPFNLIHSKKADPSPKQDSGSFGILQEVTDANTIKEPEADKNLVVFSTPTTSQSIFNFKNSNTSSSSFISPATVLTSPTFGLEMTTISSNTEKVSASLHFSTANNSTPPTKTTSSFTSILPSSTSFGAFTVTTSVPASSVVTSTFVFGNNPITTSSFENSNILTSNANEKTAAFNPAPTLVTTTSGTLFADVTIPPTLFTSAIPTNTSTILFGTKPTTSSTNSTFANVFTPLFGVASSTPSLFPSTVTSSLNFGNPNTVPSFKTVPSTFGANLSVTSTPFGVATTTPSYTSNTSTIPSTFGVNPSVAAAGTFGSASLSTASPTFGSFVNPATPSFGNTVNVVPRTTASAFGNPSNNSSFGHNTSFTAQSVFGTSTKPSFSTQSSIQTTASTPPMFGSSIAPSFNFGGKTENPFGAANSTESISKPNTGFFSTTSPNFGSAVLPTSGTSFGQNTVPVLANKSGTFGGHPSPFGNSDKDASSVFQGGKTAGGFAKPEVTQIGFGSTASTFGSPSGNIFGSQPQQASNGTAFAFGSAPPQAAPPTTFNFGPSNALEKNKSFSFSGGITPAFAGNSTPSFQSGSPVFGTPAASFGTPGPTTGVFNIGSGPASTGRARAPLKARRRT
ncbi:nuclear pore complex protein DDB_G0274915 isoform X2 [Cylas formicarius]|nr:nuclear pore complex protein DDB_G0274915 isoform X2 [Cylas formicarius]XP_060518148.1 nuclear pore complex protein DDB_G0274915 isoform X2 [Cylas formicarius]